MRILIDIQSSPIKFEHSSVTLSCQNFPTNGVPACNRITHLLTTGTDRLASYTIVAIKINICLLIHLCTQSRLAPRYKDLCPPYLLAILSRYWRRFSRRRKRLPRVNPIRGGIPRILPVRRWCQFICNQHCTIPQTINRSDPEACGCREGGAWDGFRFGWPAWKEKS